MDVRGSLTHVCVWKTAKAPVAYGMREYCVLGGLQKRGERRRLSNKGGGEQRDVSGASGVGEAPSPLAWNDSPFGARGKCCKVAGLYKRNSELSA